MANTQNDNISDVTNTAPVSVSTGIDTLVVDQNTSGMGSQIVSAPNTSDTTQSLTTENSVDPLLTSAVHPEDLDVKWTRWKCLNCDYIYEGVKALTTCPRCGNSDPEKFEDID